MEKKKKKVRAEGKGKKMSIKGMTKGGKLQVKEAPPDYRKE